MDTMGHLWTFICQNQALSSPDPIFLTQQKPKVIALTSFSRSALTQNRLQPRLMPNYPRFSNPASLALPLLPAFFQPGLPRTPPATYPWRI